MWEIMIGMSIVILQGKDLEIRLGLIFFIEPPLDFFQMTKCYMRSHRGNLRTQISTPCSYIAMLQLKSSIVACVAQAVWLGFIRISILVTCDYIASGSKVAVHGRGVAFFHGWNYHPVTYKKHRPSMYKRYIRD